MNFLAREVRIVRVAALLLLCAVGALGVLLLHSREQSARDEAVRSSFEREVRDRLPKGSSKEKIQAVFAELGFQCVFEDAVPYYATAVPLSVGRDSFEQRFLKIFVRVDSSRNVEKVEVSIFSRTL